MTVPAAAIELVKRFEGLRLDAYRCPAGRLTIGWGHTAALGAPIPRLGMRITAEDAEWILHRDIKTIADELRPLVSVELSDNRWAALLSFAFNFGVPAFRESDLREAVNAGRSDAVPAELMRWVHGGRPKRVMPGLVARREAEGALWREG